jgi:uncharacterized protein with GYD domain
VVRPVFEAKGARIVAGGYSFGEYDVVAILEAPDDTVAASLVLTIAAGGAVRAAKTTKLLSGAEWIAALQAAQSTTYRPAR